jgi:hypothetical protein
LDEAKKKLQELTGMDLDLSKITSLDDMEKLLSTIKTGGVE